MSKRLQDRVALVTGSGSTPGELGIGATIALLFADEGAAVAVVDNDRQRAQDTVAAIEDRAGRACGVIADVSNSEDCARVVAETIDRFGCVDVLVNNVGASAAGTLSELDPGEWDRVFALNVRSAALMTKEVLGPMIGRAGGSIVNVASIAALRAGGSTAYGPSKAALIALTRETAVAYGRHGIRANAVAPGHVYTPMVAGSLTDERRELRRRVAPLGIEGSASDVALAVLFLASSEARFVTGVCLPVDGGVTVTSALRIERFLFD